MGTSLHHAFDVIDGHHHIGDMASTVRGLSEDKPTPPDFRATELSVRLEILDEHNVREAVIIAGHGYLRPDGVADTRSVNNDVAAYRDNLRQRFPVAVGVVEPLYGPRGLPELARCRDELGMAGISFHTRFQGVHLDSIWIRRYLEVMGNLGLVPFIHVIGGVPEEALWELESLANDFPDMTMLVLDGFMSPETSRELIRVGYRCPNLLFDTALAISVPLFVAPAISELGAHRIFYGSDIYSWPLCTRPYTILPQLLDLGLSHADISAILGGNIRTVLGLPVIGVKAAGQ
jgi:predicted TIM-barrel fold metal-dependent hydrolase